MTLDRPSQLLSIVRERGVVAWEHGLGCFEVRGRDGLELLHRLSTNDLVSGSAPRVIKTVFTTEKGRAIADAEVVVTQHSVFLVLQESAMQVVQEWIERFTILEEIELVDTRADRSIAWVLGPETDSGIFNLAYVLEDIGAKPCRASTNTLIEGEPGPGVQLAEGGAGEAEFLNERLLGTDPSPLAHDHASREHGRICYWRSDLGHVPGMQILADRTDAERLTTATVARGRREIDASLMDLLRIMAGDPRHPNELNGETHPLEVGLSSAVSFKKGCYVGQEVIARLNAYDKVQRHLVLLEVSAGDIGNDGTLAVVHGENVVGRVTSLSGPFADGSRMALAVCRKGSNTQPGVRLHVMSGTQALAACVRAFMDPGPIHAETP